MSASNRILLLVVASSALATGTSAASDKSFLKKALEGENAEMTLAAGSRRTGLRKVCDFGKMLNEDHAAA